MADYPTEPTAENGPTPAAQSPYPTLDIPEGEHPELFAYLQSLPEVKGLPPLPGVPDAEAPAAEESAPEAIPEKTEEQRRVEALAEQIRARAKGSLVTAFMLLRGEQSDAAALLEALFKDEAYADIVHTVGQKDTYYYSSRHMTAHYATVAVLVEEKDLPYTVAKMVRYHCVTHPAPTSAVYFMNPPYLNTKTQLERVREVLRRTPAYADIAEVVTANKQLYFYSTEHMSAKYALALAERAEYREN